MDVFGLLAIFGFFCSFLPIDLLQPGPATGGDTGSHFWPLVTLVEHGLPNFSVRMWNPGNLGGEPQLVHYYPLPYFIMAAFSLFLPIGMSFNIGTLLELPLLPIAAYYCVRGLGLRFPAPLLSATVSIAFLFNERYTMWGGNFLSTLAGQFAHGYALVAILFGIGALGSEIRRGKFPRWSAFWFACVAVSHSYVLLGLPFFAFSFVCFFGTGNPFRRFVTYTLSGVLAALLSAWFLVPLIDNAPWTTPFSMKWISPNIVNEVFHFLFYPMGALLLASGIYLFVKRRSHRQALDMLLFWFIPSIGYIVYYFVFPALGLVDIRAFPQVILFMLMASSSITGLALRVSGRLGSFFLAPALLIASLWWTFDNTKNVSGWLKWNYSGWSSKELYQDVLGLSDALRGNFSMPRVVYEHNDVSKAAGTERVFEMLPFFASRATLESLYMQSTILSLMAYHIQSEVSKTPSCPFPEQKCQAPSLAPARERLRLMGVGDLILITDGVREQADKLTWLKKGESFGPWHLYHIVESPPLAEPMKGPPEIIGEDNWKGEFYTWFRAYGPASTFLVPRIRGFSPELERRLRDAQSYGGASCHPTVTVSFTGVVLRTNCPGKVHYLKFAYHSSWRADTKDELFLTSPGFIGIIPSKQEVTIRWGQTPRWHIAGGVSILTLGLLVLSASPLYPVLVRTGRKYLTRFPP